MTVPCLRYWKIAMLVLEFLPYVLHLTSAVFDLNRARMISVLVRLCPWRNASVVPRLHFKSG